MLDATRGLTMPDPSDATPPVNDSPVGEPSPPVDAPLDLPDLPPPGPENIVTEAEQDLIPTDYPPPGPENIAMKNAGPPDLPNEPPPGPAIYVSDEQHDEVSEVSDDWYPSEDG